MLNHHGQGAGSQGRADYQSSHGPLSAVRLDFEVSSTPTEVHTGHDCKSIVHAGHDIDYNYVTVKEKVGSSGM